MASQPSLSGGLSASVTRILYLTGFPKELKTKDIQVAFSEWEGQNGGFKIKWRDDTSLLIVFQDASVAKRAYLNTVAFPPTVFHSESTGKSATIRPYDGEDAQTVIQNVNARTHGSNPSRSHNGRSASISVFPAGRASSSSISSQHGPIPNFNQPPNNNNNNGFRHNAHISISHAQMSSGGSEGNMQQHNPNLYGREPSPTLPSLPSHPTLSSIINSSLSEASVVGHQDPAILASSLNPDGLHSLGNGQLAMGAFGRGQPPVNDAAGPMRIGDPGKRMLGAALGVRHPSLGARTVGNNGAAGSADQAMREVQRAMGGLAVGEQQ